MAQIHFAEIPDLVINQCPTGCINCGKIYVNVQTGNRIVCKCKICDHNKEKEELAQVVGPEASSLTTKSSKEVIHDDH
jgi:hypothetical protein